MPTIVTIAAVLAVLAALVAVRGAVRVHRAHDGMGHGCGHHGHRGHHGRWGMRHVLRRLDLGPGQEKVVREEMAQLRTLLRSEREALRGMRSDLGDALRAESLDASAIDAALRKPEDALGRVRTEVAAALGRVHAVLDAEQRERLAGMLAGGRFGWAH